MTKTAFVTGGTGFIGANLIKSLVDLGWKVTALHRKTSNLKYLREFGVQLAEGSITDKPSLMDAILADTEVVFHVAGDTSSWSKLRAQQTAIHVVGTRHMIDVAAEKGVKTFIHTSSVSVWGPPPKGTINEDTPQQGATSWINYEKTKWQAEQIALGGVEKGMKVVCINPAAVVGPYDIKTYATIFFALRDGELPGIAPATCPIVHVNDVVQAHIQAVTKGRSGHRYIVVGDHIPMRVLVAEMARLMGKAKLPPVLPRLALKIFGRLSVIGAYFTGKKPTITPEVAEMLTRTDFEFSNEKAISELKYEPKSWQEGVQDSYEWLVKEQLL